MDGERILISELFSFSLPTFQQLILRSSSLIVSYSISFNSDFPYETSRTHESAIDPSEILLIFSAPRPLENFGSSAKIPVCHNSETQDRDRSFGEQF